MSESEIIKLSSAATSDAMNRVSGTLVNDFGDIKANGNRVDFAAFQFYRVADGKVAEHWDVADFAKFQEQLTAKPAATTFKSFQNNHKR